MSCNACNLCEHPPLVDSLSRTAERLNCTFEHYHGAGNLNVIATQVHLAGSLPALPGGFQIGEKVIAAMRYEHPTDGKVMCGDVGTVAGPCNKKYLSQCHERINCTFNRYKGVGGLNVFVSQGKYNRRVCCCAHA